MKACVNKSIWGLFILIASYLPAPALAAKAESVKGTLPELSISEKDESVNLKKTAKGEVLISQTENQAIQSLTNILRKKKGSPQEPELWFRLAELYMRRAKSGRFFDLNRNEEQAQQALSFAPAPVLNQTSVDALTRASKIYMKIENDFPLFAQMDFVMFNAGFSFEQLKQKNLALEQYKKMMLRFPKSSLVPDALLAAGEIEYEQKNYQVALRYFLEIEKYKNSKVYPYGKYKAAWSYYNTQNSDMAFAKLEQVVNFFDQKNIEANSNLGYNHNLRQESLKDLALFYTESRPSTEAYEYFSRISTPAETAKSLNYVSQILSSHSREKEAIQILEELAEKLPQSELFGQTKILLVENYDNLKMRSPSLEHTLGLKKSCQSNTGWTQKYPEESDKICLIELPGMISKLAKKWWESWQRNPSQKEIAGQVRSLLEIQLAEQKMDSKQSLEIQQTNSKLRLAYAELLFQTGEFSKAKLNYLQVFNESPENDIKHQALYSAIVSSEKSKDNNQEQLRTIELYLKSYPRGEWSQDLQFKEASLLFIENQFDKAKPIFWSLADPKSDLEVKPELKIKSQDLYLDILAKQKDYDGIYQTASEFKNSTRSIASERGAELDKIILDSDLASTQEKANQQEVAQSIATLIQFHERHQNTEAGKESLWQALSKSFAADRKFESAKLAVRFAKAYPSDSRTAKSLKDGAKNFLDTGYTVEAADVLKMTSDQSSFAAKRAALELSLLDGRTQEADQLMSWFIENSSGPEKISMINLKIKSLKDRKSFSELESFERYLLSQKIEPFSGELKLKKIQQTFEKQDYTNAFNDSKTLVGDLQTSANVRAGARLIQAKVLAKEFLDQSTKTTIDRLPLVLSIKTEKLDKAQTAFLSAAKISDSESIRLEALSSLNGLYKNYVDTVGSPQLKSTLSESDRQALQTELDKLVAPIRQKLTDNTQKMAEISQKTSIVSPIALTRFEDLPETATYEPEFKSWNFSMFLDNEAAKTDTTLKGLSCTFKEGLALPQLIGAGRICEQNPTHKSNLEKIIAELSDRFGSTEWPLYFQARLAYMNMNFDKAHWLAEESLKRNAKNPYVTYLLGQTKVQVNTEVNSLMPIFLKAEELNHPDNRLKGLSTAISYSQNQCPVVLQKSEYLSKDSQIQLGVSGFVAECLARTEKAKLAIDLLNFAAKKQSSSEVHLQLARVYELYLVDIKSAIREYEKARQLEKNSEVLAWIDRKLGYLKIPKSMSQLKGKISESKGAIL